jgi:hypothetical protein
VPKITNANELTQYALKVLRLAGFYVWRQNNGGVFDQKLGRYRANSATKGISDIMGFHKRSGIIIACEIKTGKDRLSAEQVDFLAAVEAAGGVALVVRHADELKHLLPQQ